MSTYTLSLTELEAQLQEQLELLQRSAHLFDQGYLSEAKRIAVTLRIILHSGRHRSLLEQLGKATLPFLDTATAPVPGNLLTTHGLIGFHFENQFVRYFAKIDQEDSSKLVDFDSWWHATVFVDNEKRTMTRSELVLGVTDQDGGAHVDRSLRQKYAALSRQNSLGWCTGGNSKPLGSPHLHAIRQIGHEVLKTLLPGYVRTLSQAEDDLIKPQVGGGKMRFSPGFETLFSTKPVAPLTPGRKYKVEADVDALSCGSIMMVVGGQLSKPATHPGAFQDLVAAGNNNMLGVFGQFTDAVIDRVSAKEATD